MEATHTKGPWRCEANGAIVGGYAGCGTHICDVPTMRWAMSQAAQRDQPVAEWLGKCHDESQANARLIAASPELLAFARECARTDSECGETLREIARNLTAKL